MTLLHGEALDRQRQAALLAQVPVAIDQPLRARAAALALDQGSRLVADMVAPRFVEAVDDHLRLLGNGRVLGFALQAAPALDLALSGEAFAVGELPGLDDDEARRDLAVTLLTNGFVRLS